MLVSRTALSFVLALLLTGPNFLTAQTPVHKRVPKITGSHNDWTASPQELFAPYWTLEPGWSTELEMRNNVPWHDLRMTPVLLTADGDEVPLTPVNLKPEEIASINLRDAVASAKPELMDKIGSFGSVVFRFDGTGAANGFAGSVVRREGHPIGFHFDAEGAGSIGVEGMWWLPAESATDYLILSNPTSKPVTGKLTLSDASGTTQRLTLTISPRQSVRTNLREVLRAPANGAFGGLSLSVDKEGELSATEIVFDEATGLATIMKLFDRQSIAEFDRVESRVLRAPMMALSQPDRSLAFPSGTVLEPKIFLCNAGPAPALIAPGVNWRNESKWGSSALPRITLLPGQMKILSLADFQKSGRIPADATWATVNLSFTGRSGDLVAIAMSYDKTSRYGLQTPFTEGINHLMKGSMWHVDSTHNTLITTGNGGSEPTRAQLTLFYNGGQDKYRVEKLLSPGQQIWLNLGEVLRNQVPDSDGKTIPPDVMFGSYELRDLGHPILGLLYEGKLIVDKTYGHASYGCAHCCGYSQAQLAPNPFGGPPNIDNQDIYQAFHPCDSKWYDFDGAFNPFSSDTTVATLAASLNLHTVAMGGATTSGENTLEYQSGGSYCQQVKMPGKQPVTVQKPTSLKVISSGVVPLSSLPGKCTGAPYGIAIGILYQVLDQNGNPINSDSLVPQEQVIDEYLNGTGPFNPVPDWTNVGPNAGMTTKYTDASGRFWDQPYGICTSFAILSDTVKQPLSILLSGINYTVRTNNWSTVSTVPNHGSVTNNVDVSQSY